FRAGHLGALPLAIPLERSAAAPCFDAADRLSTVSLGGHSTDVAPVAGPRMEPLLGPAILRAGSEVDLLRSALPLAVEGATANAAEPKNRFGSAAGSRLTVRNDWQRVDVHRRNRCVSASCGMAGHLSLSQLWL